MDRTVSDPRVSASLRAFARLAVGLVCLLAPGCARFQKYRAQNSPLTVPLLGRVAKPDSRGMAARRVQPQIAWSGEPNTAPPSVRLASPSLPRAGTLATLPAPAGTASANDVKPEADGLEQVRSLIKLGRDRLAATPNYQVALNRQERVGDTLQPAEDVLLSVRREPRAIRLEWPSGPHKGREVLYSKAETGGMMQIHMGDSALPLPRMTLAPDSPMVMKNSRHPITEAGLEPILDQIEASIAAKEGVAYAGMRTPPEVGRRCHSITRTTAKGEHWVIDLDAETSLPALVEETSARGELLERYVFRDLKPDLPVLAEASAFDPDQRWGASRGFFSRVARTNSAPAVAR